jgi:3alpha(or 20beta)-hydroxysteroid dehydrogenase
MARREDMVGMVVYLMSDAAAYTTGQQYFVDGGWTAV